MPPLAGSAWVTGAGVCHTRAARHARPSAAAFLLHRAQRPLPGLHLRPGGLPRERVGPVARRVITCVDTDQIVATLRSLDQAGEPSLVLGGGSNVLIADDLTDLTVVRLASPVIEVDGPILRAQAGADWDAVVANMVYVWTGLAQALGLKYYAIPGIDVAANRPVHLDVA